MALAYSWEESMAFPQNSLNVELDVFICSLTQNMTLFVYVI
jgi:hypothetical protein